MRRLTLSQPLTLAAAFVLALWTLAASAGSSTEQSTVEDSTARNSSTKNRQEQPWIKAGLSAEQAAAHLLDRFSFGPRPGEVKQVARIGPMAWLEQQLAADLPEPRLESALEPLESLDMGLRQIADTYPSLGRVLREAQEAGALPADMMERAIRRNSPVAPPDSAMEDPSLEESSMEAGMEEDPEADRRALRRELVAFGRKNNYRSLRRLTGELMTQKLYRALYAENQLHEVMTSFWFNHFYVSLADTQARPYILPYERDAIRAHALGTFRDLLGATARHPAMLLYLDNFNSTAPEGTRTTFEYAVERSGLRGRAKARALEAGSRGRRRPGDQAQPERRIGLNENYARELLELHTLGVDGGYTQDDVVEVARAFTGWTTVPPGASREDVERRQERARRSGLGFVFEDEFIFRPNAHDAEKKQILGRKLPAGRGIEDGEDVLDLLARHPSTARHIAHKLAVRFVSDQPSDALVERLAKSFKAHQGDSTELVRELVATDEFWAAANRGAKVKSPFELALSSLRILDAEVTDPEPLLRWISRIGQPLYAYKAPTGYPDSAETWVNTGALLYRMNFGLDLAAGRVEGVRFDLAALNDGREPESRQAALERYVELLLPARDHKTTIELLSPIIEDPELDRKVADAAGPDEASEAFEELEEESESLRYYGVVRFEASVEEMAAEGLLSRPRPSRRDRAARRREARAEARGHQPASPLEQVVGVILGSPAFQRR